MRNGVNDSQEKGKASHLDMESTSKFPIDETAEILAASVLEKGREV
jgi:hypothetical protein